MLMKKILLVLSLLEGIVLSTGPAFAQHYDSAVQTDRRYAAERMH
jgi:hypothetical protein